MWIANIRVNGKVYEFIHCLDDDSRQLLDEGYNIVAVIGSSCNFFSGGWDKWLGRLSGYGYTWKYFPEVAEEESWDTNVPVQDHHWKRLEEAEIATLKHLIETGVIDGN